MFRRLQIASAMSVAAHIALFFLLRGNTNPLPPAPLREIAMEIVYDRRTPAAPLGLPPAGKTSRVLKSLPRATAAKPSANTTTSPPTPSITKGAVAPVKNVDRLSTLRASPRIPMPGTPLPDEEPDVLFARPVPNAMKRSAIPRDPKVVEGRGGVKMFLGDDGDIKSFANPEPHVEGLGFRFDLTDKVMALLGSNPYRYEQHRLAEATREDRFCQRLKAQADNERQALFSLPGELAALWADTTLTPGERRKLLFERWDECLEDKHDERSAGAAAMRGIIESFIRTNLPLGSPNAYPPRELAVLNRHRTSSAPFEPYTRTTSSAPAPDAGGG